MSDLRLDPITGHWVAIAENRFARPYEFQQIETRRPGLACPFCVGNESQTPRAVLALDGAGRDIRGTARSDQDWLVRVVPNKYPAFVEAAVAPAPGGPHQAISIDGVHEVIIESPRHVASLADLNDDELAASFSAYQMRLGELCHRPDLAHAMLFKNCRPEAGASIEHVHSQLVVTPMASAAVSHRQARARDHLQRHGHSLVGELVAWELERGDRVLAVTDNYVAVCPYASRFAYQVWIAPRQPPGPFATLGPQLRDELARLCQHWTARIEELLDYPAYNLLFHFSPFAEAELDHWYVELFPRLTRPAGLEWGAGWWINTVAPETAASRLRGDA
jgi:UDPglucose--hexose-1-phosphate uridylyltransferase